MYKAQKAKNMPAHMLKKPFAFSSLQVGRLLGVEIVGRGLMMKLGTAIVNRHINATFRTWTSLDPLTHKIHIFNET